MRAVFNYVDLFKCEQVIDDEDFVDFGLLFLVLAVLPHFDVFLSSVLQLNLKTTTVVLVAKWAVLKSTG